MSNEEILNLWDCNKLTCGEVVEVARTDERAKVIEIINSMDFDFGDYYDHTYAIREMIEKRLKE